jgi:hypothetical protein
VDRLMGRYIQRDNLSDVTIDSADSPHQVTLEADTATAANLEKAIPTGQVVVTSHQFAAAEGEGATDWTTASGWDCQYEVVAAGADVAHQAFFRRINSAGTTALQTNPASAATSGTGLFSNPFGNWTAANDNAGRASTDRFALRLQSWNGNMMTVQALTLRVNTTDSYADVPWSVGGGVTVGGSTADAIVRAIQSASAALNAVVLASRANTATLDALVATTKTGSHTLDALARAAVDDAFVLDATAQASRADSFLLASLVEGEGVQALAVDGIVQAGVSGGVVVDAMVAVGRGDTLALDAWVMAVSVAGSTVDAEVSLTGKPVWTTPLDGVAISSTPTLSFEIPLGTAAMHFQIELDTVDTFDGGDYRLYDSSVDQAGWEYWNGGTWVAIPAGGVPTAYIGNEAHFIVSVPLASDLWYRRVRAGV